MVAMVLRSKAFLSGAALPIRFAAEGEGISPALYWRYVHGSARSLVLHVSSVTDDGRETTHWLAYDIVPGLVDEIPEGGPLPSGCVGRNENGDPTYLPPRADEQRTLTFTLYATRTKIGGETPLGWDDVWSRIEGDVVRRARLRAGYPAAPSRAWTYDLEDLESLGPNHRYSHDPRIHDGVVIAGQDREPGVGLVTRAAIWDEAWQVLPDPAEDTTTAICIQGIRSQDQSGRFVGYFASSAGKGTYLPCYWDVIEGRPTSTVLPLPTGAVDGYAHAISADKRTIVGECGTAAGSGPRLVAVIWELAEDTWSATILPSGEMKAGAFAWDDVAEEPLGDRWDVYEGPVYAKHGVRWSRDRERVWVAHELAHSTQATPPPLKDVETEARGCQDGLVLGEMGPRDELREAVYWAANGALVKLQAGTDTVALDHFGGVICGVDFGENQERAFVWTSEGGKQLIHPEGCPGSRATGIDSSGTIVGVMGDVTRRDADREVSIFRLPPRSVPESDRPDMPRSVSSAKRQV